MLKPITIPLIFPEHIRIEGKNMKTKAETGMDEYWMTLLSPENENLSVVSKGLFIDFFFITIILKISSASCF